MNRRDLLKFMFASPFALLPNSAESANVEDWPAHFEEAKVHWQKMMTLMGLSGQTIADEMDWLENRKGLWVKLATPCPRVYSNDEEKDILDEAEAEIIDDIPADEVILYEQISKKPSKARARKPRRARSKTARKRKTK